MVYRYTCYSMWRSWPSHFAAHRSFVVPCNGVVVIRRLSGDSSFESDDDPHQTDDQCHIAATNYTFFRQHYPSLCIPLPHSSIYFSCLHPQVCTSFDHAKVVIFWIRIFINSIFLFGQMINNYFQCSSYIGGFCCLCNYQLLADNGHTTKREFVTALIWPGIMVRIDIS